MAKRKIKSELHNMIKDIKLPILTLDNRWHLLFDDQKTERILELEEKVNNLLKRQGKLINDVKDMKRLKKTLIKEIMMNMDLNAELDKEKDKKLDKNKKYINELNDKINKAMDELGDLPYLIRDANAELVTESIHVLYERLIKNRDRLNEISERINRLRDELEQKVEQKHELEANNAGIYSYMHDLLGVDFMNVLDSEYKHAANDKFQISI
ncbi:MAG: hypothetical protein GX757_05615 [Clostridiales bacterium]|nr:hypothetical protein [Clostridiales bacterium]